MTVAINNSDCYLFTWCLNNQVIEWRTYLQQLLRPRFAISSGSLLPFRPLDFFGQASMFAVHSCGSPRRLLFSRHFYSLFDGQTCSHRSFQFV
jgi:hypothetical protein